MTRRQRRVELFQDRSKAKAWRFRLVGGNGEKQTRSQPYSRKDSARRGARRAHPGVAIVTV